MPTIWPAIVRACRRIGSMVDPSWPCTSAQSPRANTDSSLVHRLCASTTMPRATVRPARLASRVSGSTPAATRARSKSARRWWPAEFDQSRTSRRSGSACSGPELPTELLAEPVAESGRVNAPSATPPSKLTPRAVRASRRRMAVGMSRRARSGKSSASSRVTCAPAHAKSLANSQPTRPAPTISSLGLRPAAAAASDAASKLARSVA